jgi:hypothetical protein
MGRTFTADIIGITPGIILAIIPEGIIPVAIIPVCIIPVGIIPDILLADIVPAGILLRGRLLADIVGVDNMGSWIAHIIRQRWLRPPFAFIRTGKLISVCLQILIGRFFFLVTLVDSPQGRPYPASLAIAEADGKIRIPPSNSGKQTYFVRYRGLSTPSAGRPNEAASTPLRERCRAHISSSVVPPPRSWQTALYGLSEKSSPLNHCRSSTVAFIFHKKSEIPRASP